jgi:hypothetical protein
MTQQNEKQPSGAEKPSAAGPHNKPELADTRKTPGSGTLPPPGSSDPNDMAPTG